MSWILFCSHFRPQELLTINRHVTVGRSNQLPGRSARNLSGTQEHACAVLPLYTLVNSLYNLSGTLLHFKLAIPQHAGHTLSRRDRGQIGQGGAVSYLLKGG